MDRAMLETLLEEGHSLAEIGRRCGGRHESTVAYWLARHGLAAAGAERNRAKGGLEREQLEAFVARGLSIAEIAREVERSKATVRYWLGRFGLRTSRRAGRPGPAGAESARAAGLRSALMLCERHGEQQFLIDRRGVYRCRRCSSEAVSRRRRKVKAILVAEAGGSCRLCGYSASPRALHFHHLDPEQKRFALNARGVSLSLERLRAEARKCILLCSNCHAEVEHGMVEPPLPAELLHSPDDPG